MKDLKNQQGQALLIILLVMAVGLTIGLAVVSRSVTDIRISSQEEESARAFSAAEAGIEEALLENLAVGVGTSGTVGEISYSVSSIEQGGSQEYDLGGGKFLSGDTQTVWLIGHTADGDFDPSVTFPTDGVVDICWGEPGTPADQETTPALEVSLVYLVGSEFRTARRGYDPNVGRTGSNKFDLAGTSGCLDLAFNQTINLASDFGDLTGATLYLYALRLKLLYNENSQPIKVSSSDNFPSQGKCYVSTAKVEESGVTRKVQQCQTHKAPPAIFDYVLFSGGDLEK